MSARLLPQVSIVIVSWNAKSYLAECLLSLRSGAYGGAMETIVVDNGSKDGSIEMVRERFPEVRLICNDENLGFAKANNLGIFEAAGDYIALINSDVRILPNCITTLVDYCESHPTVGLVGPYIIGANGEQQLSCRAAPNLWNMLCRALALDVLFSGSGVFNGYYLGHLDHAAEASVDILSGCFWLAPRRALADVGLLDESFFIYGEDMDWCKRYLDAGWEIVFVPQAASIHYGGASSANSPVRFFVEKQKADLQYWRKHHSFLAVRGYIAISVTHHFLRVIGYSLWSLVNKSADRTTSLYKVQRSLACLRWFVSRDFSEKRRA